MAERSCHAPSRAGNSGGLGWSADRKRDAWRRVGGPMKTLFVGFCSRGGGEPDPGGCGRKRRRDSRREKTPATEKDAGKREKTPEKQRKKCFSKKIFTRRQWAD